MRGGKKSLVLINSEGAPEKLSVLLQNWAQHVNEPFKGSQCLLYVFKIYGWSRSAITFLYFGDFLTSIDLKDAYTHTHIFQVISDFSALLLVTATVNLWPILTALPQPKKYSQRFSHQFWSFSFQRCSMPGYPSDQRLSAFQEMINFAVRFNHFNSAVGLLCKASAGNYGIHI